MIDFNSLGNSVGCVGSRTLTKNQLLFCEAVGGSLAGLGHSLVTGNGLGADNAFQRGYSYLPERVELWLPWKDFNKEAIVEGNKIKVIDYNAAEYLWDYFGMQKYFGSLSDMRQGERLLFARNVAIVEMSDSIIAWPGSTRGTRSTIKLAELMGSKVLNIANIETRRNLAGYLNFANSILI